MSLLVSLEGNPADEPSAGSVFADPRDVGHPVHPLAGGVGHQQAHQEHQEHQEEEEEDHQDVHGWKDTRH